MVSYYNSKTKEKGYMYDIGNLFSYSLGDNYYKHSCYFHLKIKEETLEYDLILMVYDYEKYEYKKIKFDYQTPEFKSVNEIFNFFNRLLNNYDKDFIRKLRLTIKESEDK